MTDRDRAASCRGPYGGEGVPEDCGDPARFEVARHRRTPLRVCPVHLGPSLLLADGVLWPPKISLIR
ncbi:MULTISPECIES: hypothetical protein [Streptomyces rochei group]|uniref:Uncharacterized protein n=1 Tax=Streptomyces vinaceusdrappus TaxID=67376 RepID=A0ABY6BVZ5_9ACTN|nr:hypothetical protein [Streptomyces vinaceusdrappus]UXI79920.1 hypothetical protein N6Q81_18805 [Streptomyces vinaceusdrappus]